MSRTPDLSRRLAGVHPDLVRLCQRAFALTPDAFRITETLRTPARQAKLVKAGASRTLDSRHLTGHAVDLVALVDGKVRWDWPLYYPIAATMAEAARIERLALVWGGTWGDIRLIHSAEAAEGAVAAYVRARRKQGLSAFIDGPHFELSRSTHP
jgi:peptidoglycan L-alanyl-D-glutamate endopeptidase CwlK